MDWNPIHWLKDALGDVKRPLDSIEKWVLKRIAQAGGLIENDIRKAANAVWSHFHDVGNTISHLAGQINNLAAAAGKDVGVSISWLTHEVDTLVGDAVGAAQKSLGALAKDAEGWLHDAESYADTALSTFDRDVLARRSLVSTPRSRTSRRLLTRFGTTGSMTCGHRLITRSTRPRSTPTPHSTGSSTRATT